MHEPALEEESEVLTDRGLSETNMRNEITHSVLPRREMLQHIESGGIAQRIEQVGVVLRRRVIQLRPHLSNHRHLTMISLFDDFIDPHSL